MNTDIQVQIESKAATLFDHANAIQITDDITCQQAEETMRAIKKTSKAWVDFWEPMRKAAEENKRQIMEKINLLKLTAPGNNKAKVAYNAIAAKASAYRHEQERIRREAAEKIRQEQIRQEEAARLAAAEAAEKSGDNELAEAIVEQPVYVPPPKPVEVPKTDGVSYRETWKHQVFALNALVEAVACGRAPLQALQPNDTFLRQQAKAMKTENLYPGVRAYAEKTPNIRA